jgi:hypothetical protein
MTSSRSSNSCHYLRVNDLVRKARSAYRKSKGLTEDQYLTFFAPGNSEKEVSFSFKSFKDGLKAFSEHADIKNIDKSFFKVVILLPEDNVPCALCRN